MGDPNLPWSEKAAFIRYVINPTLVVLSGRPEKKNGLLTSDFVNRMHHLVWVGTLSQDIDDSVKIELIHFTTLLVQHYSEMLDEARKDIIKWAWHHISTDDAIVKHTAYLLTARFFAVVQTPQKFILRTWSASSVRHTLMERPQYVRKHWQHWCHRSHRWSQGYQLPAVGFDYSSSVDRGGCSRSSAPAEKSGVVKMWHTPLGFRENIVSYLVRVAMINDPTNKLVAPRALALLEKMVHPSGWSDVTVGLRYFLRSLEQVMLYPLFDVYNISHLCLDRVDRRPCISSSVATAKILQVISAEQTDAWYTANAILLQKLVRKGMVTDDYNLHDALHPVFERLLRLYPLPKEDEEPQQGRLPNSTRTFRPPSLMDCERLPHCVEPC
ncbi:Transcription-associated protein [Salix suchowensis]|nr:Transcription-associated protein [Salix suchowensis]